ncbi:hypothetical protein [Paracoccus mutanolyticus]|nr:hypothetical protein [Paracoccus mutanolyticus]
MAQDGEVVLDQVVLSAQATQGYAAQRSTIDVVPVEGVTPEA